MYSATVTAAIPVYAKNSLCVVRRVVRVINAALLTSIQTSIESPANLSNKEVRAVRMDSSVGQKNIHSI